MKITIKKNSVVVILVSEANKDSMQQLEAQAKILAAEAARDQPSVTREKIMFVRQVLFFCFSFFTLQLQMQINLHFIRLYFLLLKRHIKNICCSLFFKMCLFAKR